MTSFSETAEAEAFIASAGSRETSPEVMRAIAFHARTLAEAEALWQGDGLGVICHDTDLLETATGNGRIDAGDLLWGGKPYRLSTDAVLDLARKAHNPARYSIPAEALTFQAAA